jgi:tetratricopeptide (TPR) repeat protein
MNKKDSSSWSEIKSLDERLARDPASFCFARLSETYLKIGLVADALHTARQGVAKHPGYLAGRRALAMACNANGLHEESRSILEQVTAAMPEDTVAQKLLASLYVEAGDKSSAIRAYTTLLDFSPDDVQNKAQLEELQQVDSGEPLQVITPSEPVGYDEKIDEEAEEDIYELSEADIVHDEEKASETDVEPAAASAAEVTSSDHHDPLSTLTLAELYERQGFVAKALDIYRTILADDPANVQLQTKIALLESQVLTAQQITEQPAAPDHDDEQESFDAAASEDVSAPLKSLIIAPPVPEDTTIFEAEPVAPAAFEDMPAPVEAQVFSPLAHNQADNVVGTLDSWLENIRRIKACR